MHVFAWCCTVLCVSCTSLLTFWSSYTLDASLNVYYRCIKNINTYLKREPTTTIYHIGVANYVVTYQTS